jgi:hypothetical protein
VGQVLESTTTVPIASSTTPVISDFSTVPLDQATLISDINTLQPKNLPGSFNYGIFDLKWSNLNDSTDFVFTYKTTTPDSNWGGFAFSKDPRMVKKKNKK